MSTQGGPGRRPRLPRPASRDDDAGRIRPEPSRAELRPAEARQGPKDDPVRLFEAVYFYIYDVGLSIDQKKVAALIPAHDDLGLVKRRDTPASLSLPRPLVVRLNEDAVMDPGQVEAFTAHAKIYEDGAVSVVIRTTIRLRISELHSLHSRRFSMGDESVTIDGYAEESFFRLISAITPAVVDPSDRADFDSEDYVAFCLIDGHVDPVTFLQENRSELAALLIGESPSEILHESQVSATLGKPLSYRKDDLAVFDMDRCIIIDPRRDYEDLLLIVENANYQLLELRVLDKLLDRWLDEAEKDMRFYYSDDRKGLRKLGSSVQKKFAHIQSLRFDALFILENLENSSKIIGDYYLGQVYDRLCAIFNTEGWKWSIERRLDTLQSIYEMVKTDTNERKMLWMEAVFIIVCIIFPLIQIFQVWITSR